VTQKDELLLHAAKYYKNTLATWDDFISDYNRFIYLKRLLNRYKTNKDDLKIRLIINHVIIIANVFGVDGCVFLTKKIMNEYLEQLRPILLYLGYISEDDMSEVLMDYDIVKELRKI